MSREISTPPLRRAPLRRGPRMLALDHQSAARDAFAARGFENPQLVLRWREFAGPILGLLTAPIALSPQGQLTISADPSVAVFLQHQTPQLIQRVNLALGAAAVAKVKVVSGKFRRPPPARAKPALSSVQRHWAAHTAGQVQDPDLRAALQKLAESVAAEAIPPAIAPLRPKS
jgi:hypothetical protein